MPGSLRPVPAASCLSFSVVRRRMDRRPNPKGIHSFSLFLSSHHRHRRRRPSSILGVARTSSVSTFPDRRPRRHPFITIWPPTHNYAAIRPHREESLNAAVSIERRGVGKTPHSITLYSTVMYCPVVFSVFLRDILPLRPLVRAAASSGKIEAVIDDDAEKRRRVVSRTRRRISLLSPRVTSSPKTSSRKCTGRRRRRKVKR